MIKALIKTEVSSADIREQVMWIVNLSNGETAYQCDFSPEEMTGDNSWLCLKRYVEENNLFIKDMILRFRDHVELVGSDVDGYYFARVLFASALGYCQDFYNAGVVCAGSYLAGGNIYRGRVTGKQWIIPELIVFESFERDLALEHNRDLVIIGRS